MIIVPTGLLGELLATGMRSMALQTVIGLGLILLGQRTLHHRELLGPILTILGVLMVFAAAMVRVGSILKSKGDARKAARLLLFCHLGVGLALVLYLFSTDKGLGWLGLADPTTKGAVHAHTALTVAWVIVLVISLLPMVLVEASLGVRRMHRGGALDEAGVELFRVRELILSGVTMALAASFLMVTCNVAAERNIRRDVSYFKTSAPGESTVNIVKNTPGSIKVLLFFPPVNEVGDEVRGYFDDLARRTGGKVVVEDHDRELERPVATKYGVTTDGTIVFAKADDKDDDQGKDKADKLHHHKTYPSITLPTDMTAARRGKSKLRNLDSDVHKTLRQLVAKKATVYLTVGHGEMNDPASIDPALRAQIPARTIQVLRMRLADDQYTIKELPPFDLAKGVPDDADVVMVLAPAQPLRPEELDALGAFLDKGGNLFFALDPRGTAGLGSLEGHLGVAFDPTPIVDDTNYYHRRGGDADKRLAVTTQFSAHPSTTSLSRSTRGELLLIDSGVLVDHPFESKGTPPKRTYVIRTMETAWQDKNDNLHFDSGDEKKSRYNVAAAIEGPKVTGDDGKTKDGFRAMVFADGDLFRDLILTNSQGMRFKSLESGPLLDDAVNWLAGVEVFSGTIVSEDDTPIEHTHGQDEVWFALTIVGAPLLVLAAGLLGTWARRRRSLRKQSPEVAS
jgi:gliding motility-associatede transport system auxiliary component